MSVCFGFLSDLLLEKMITDGIADSFCVGNNGNFDRMARSVVKEMKIRYPNIQYSSACLYA